jgi:hypothetical protein
MPFVISTDPTKPPTRVYACGHRRRDHSIQTILAVFTDRAEASAWCESANEWYGIDHPFYPVTIVGDNILLAPQPFPLRASEPTPRECYGCVNVANACARCRPNLEPLLAKRDPPAPVFTVEPLGSFPPGTTFTPVEILDARAAPVRPRLEDLPF